MPVVEIQLHKKLLEELLGNTSHSSAQKEFRSCSYCQNLMQVLFGYVREMIGVTLSMLCSNIRLHTSFSDHHSDGGDDFKIEERSWDQFLIERAFELVTNIRNANQFDKMEISTDTSPNNGIVNGDSKDDVKWMETLFHFIISSLKSGRSSYLMDIIVGLLYPVISLQFLCGNRGHDVPK